MKSASSAESVGRFWLRKFSELMKQSALNVFKRLKAIGFSHGQFGFVVEAPLRWTMPERRIGQRRSATRAPSLGSRPKRRR